MTGGPGEALALVLLAAVLGWAVVRPCGLGEVWAAVPAALVVLLVGTLSSDAARDRARELGPTLGFLAGVLVIADACARAGVFAWTGRALAGAARGEGRRLLALTFAAAAATTAVLSLDATVLLLTPTAIAAAAAARLRARPHAYACAHLANGASLLFPVSNLTNLLAFAAAGVGFLRFGALMLLPWLAVIAVEWVVLSRAFGRDLAEPGEPAPAPGAPPRGTLAVVGLTLVGFALSAPLGIDPAWVAGAGALALVAPGLLRRAVAPLEVVRAAAPGFLVFVLALALVVEAAQANGLSDQVGTIVPGGDGLLALLGIAFLAAVAANALNNLPAILVLLPTLHGTGPVLAALVGVGVGPNLTYTGSLATLLWRRVVLEHGAGPSAWSFLRLGLLTVPAALVAATVALWLSLGAIG